jgi:glycosyltransferase involved in cell wall biosynthesis
MTSSMKPVVSVVMPVHNAGRFLERAMQSVLAQTLREFEFIIVDDGSTDETPQILARFADDPRVLLRPLPKSGISAALNHGVSQARAPFVARMDADDEMLPERLESQREFLLAHPELGGCGTYYHLINEHGDVIGDGRSPLISRRNIEWHLADHGHLIYPHPTIMFRREVVNALGGYREEYRACEDVDLFLRMYRANQPILIQPKYLLRFRAHSTSTTARNAALQFHYNTLIHTNHFSKQRGGREASVDEYFTRLDTASLPERSLNWCKVTSFLLHRSAARARTAERHLAAPALLLAAVALNPPDAYWKAVRVLRRRIAGALAQ